MANRLGDTIRQWWYDRPVLFKGLFVVGIPVIPLLGLNLLFFAAQERAQAFDEELTLAVEVAQRSQEFLIPLLNADAGVKGFALSGDVAYLRVVDLNRGLVPARLERLQEALQGLEGGNGTVSAVEGMTATKLHQLERMQAAAESAAGGPIPGETVSGTLLRASEAAMDSLRAVLQPLRDRPDLLLEEREASALDPASLPARIVGAASLFGVFGGLLAGVLFSTSVGKRIQRLQENTVRLSHDEPLLPTIHCNDEIGRLALGIESAKELLQERAAEIRESEARLARAVRGSRDGLWDWNLESDEIYFSPRWKEMLGYDEADLEDEYPTFQSLVHPEDLPRVEDELRIWVRDTGIGIAREDQERIFGEFVQVESSYARIQQGTGLGLPLTRKLVTLHGGRLEVESEFARGSTFTLWLPLEGGGAPQLQSEGEAPNPSQSETSILPGAPTVLVVEDDPSFRRLLRAYLTEEGYAVIEAAGGNEALTLARSERPDAITLDIVLPQKDGWTVLRALKSDPEVRGIPVFAVTVTEDRELGITLGAAGFFTKPVDRHALMEAVTGVVPNPGGALRVLAVDDDEDARTLIRSSLEEEGHEVILAAGGREGIERARSEQPDLIILDLLMLDITGFDVAVALRKDHETEAIPILVWTAKELTEADRLRLNSRVQAVGLKGSRTGLLHALERVMASGRRS